MSTTKHELPLLPYALDALEPMISARTMEFHYGKHHKGYVDNLNNLIAGTKFEKLSIEEIIKQADGGPIFNNAAQTWNHTFYFEGLTPTQKIEPTGELLEAIEISFGSFGSMKEQFSKAAISLFGSGWVWLVIEGKELSISPMSNAYTPIKEGRTPIMCCDIWEHSYYLDYQNRRIDYIEQFWKLVDWAKAEKRYAEHRLIAK